MMGEDEALLFSFVFLYDQDCPRAETEIVSWMNNTLFCIQLLTRGFANMQ